VPTLGEFVNFKDILAEELNVKTVLQGSELRFDLAITPELKREGLSREVVRHIQNARKQAGLNVDDRIALGLVTHDDELRMVISEHADVICAETLAMTISSSTYSYQATVMVEGTELSLSLQKT